MQAVQASVELWGLGSVGLKEFREFRVGLGFRGLGFRGFRSSGSSGFPEIRLGLGRLIAL